MKTYSPPAKYKFQSSPRPASTVVDTIVMHSTAGASIAGDFAALEARGLAYHYLIDRDGKVYKLVPSKRMASHAGSSYGPHEEARGTPRTQFPFTAENRRLGRVHKFMAGCSVNGYTIGISFCNRNNGEEAITPAQLQSAEELVSELKKAFPLKFVTCHFEVSPKRKSDPRLFDLDKFSMEVGLKAWRFPR